MNFIRFSPVKFSPRLKEVAVFRTPVMCVGLPDAYIALRRVLNAHGWRCRSPEGVDDFVGLQRRSCLKVSIVLDTYGPCPLTAMSFVALASISVPASLQ